MFDSDYQFITTFWLDFTIADKFGKTAVNDTFVRAFNEWKNNYMYLTELVLILNWKIWEHHGKNNELAKIYDSLWRVADEYAMDTLKGEELNYFIRVTD